MIKIISIILLTVGLFSCGSDNKGYVPPSEKNTTVTDVSSETKSELISEKDPSEISRIEDLEAQIKHLEQQRDIIVSVANRNNFQADLVTKLMVKYCGNNISHISEEFDYEMHKYIDAEVHEKEQELKSQQQEEDDKRRREQEGIKEESTETNNVDS